MNEEQKQAVADAKIKLAEADRHLTESGIWSMPMVDAIESLEDIVPQAHESVQNGTADGCGYCGRLDGHWLKK